MKLRKILFVSFVALTLFLTTSCDDTKKGLQDVAKVSILTGNNQTLKVGEESKLIKVEFFGETVKGMFGGDGTADPIIGTKAKLNLPSTLELVAGKNQLISDKAGMVIISVKANSPGDHYFDIISEQNPSKKATFRITSGIKIEGDKQEIVAGSASDEFGITLTDVNGNVVPNVPVYFEVTSNPTAKAKSKLTKTKVITDAEGTALTSLQTDSVATGAYKIKAEISCPNKDISYRSVEITQMSISRFNLVITVLAGLALFVFGMTQMTNGLQQVAGNKLKTILGYFAKNRFVAILTGTVVTGFIQSSSACTVMVVGFVNAGLLSLQQAIGVIFGANIGTTVTAQMLSFKLENLAFPAIILGVVGYLLAKKTRTKGWMSVILGFGLLFYGMGIMSEELKGLARFPSFIEFFKSFDCSPVNGTMPIQAVLGAIFIGTMMTVLVQSSSATIGITIALALSGLINFYTAVPLILGDNIGTTITAILASIGGTKRSKQAAIAHTLFNVIGAVYMTLLFYVTFSWTDNQPIYLYFINEITDGNVFAPEPENIARHVAMAHTLFNIFNVLLMLPLIGFFVKICNLLIPIPPDEQEINKLDPSFLKTPSLALQQTVSEISSMTALSWEMIDRSLLMVQTGNFKDEAFLADSENRVDKMQDEVNNYLSKLTKSAQLTTTQSLALPILVHCNNNAERLGDNAEDIMALAKRIYAGNKLSAEMSMQISELKDLLKLKYHFLVEAFSSQKLIDPKEYLKQKYAFQTKLAEIENYDLESLRQGKEDVISGVVFIEIITIMGRVNGRINSLIDRTYDLINKGVVVKQPINRK